MVLWLAMGRQLHDARLRAHLFQRDVAAACGITPASYSSIERGYIRPRPEVLERIAAYLQLDSAELRRLAEYEPARVPPAERV